MQVDMTYEPRAQQIEIHENLSRFSVLVCHRRFGKTVFCINELIVRALECTNERPRFAYIAPLYRQAKQVAWDYLKHYASEIPNVTFNETELRADFPNGARITLYGADKPDALRGIYLDGVVLDEFAQMSPKAWSEVIRPALSDRGGWAIFIGTPMGHNAFYDLYEYAKEDNDWYAGVFRASDTNIIPEKELNAAAKEMSEDEYNQEFECSFEAAIQGAYYSEQIKQMRQENRICKVPYEPNLEVNTAWDLGINDQTVILFYQVVGKEIRILDCVADRGLSIPSYVQIQKNKDYTYGKHYLPHDAAYNRLTTGKSISQQLRELGLDNLVVQQRTSDVLSDIQTVRTLFPQIWIDESLVTFIDALSQYRTELDEKKNTFKSTPLHDWTSDYADAMRCLALAIQKPATNNGCQSRKRNPLEIRLDGSNYEEMIHRPMRRKRVKTPPMIRR